jgi:hypothetical protein
VRVAGCLKDVNSGNVVAVRGHTAQRGCACARPGRLRGGGRWRQLSVQRGVVCGKIISCGRWVAWGGGQAGAGRGVLRAASGVERGPGVSVRQGKKRVGK